MGDNGHLMGFWSLTIISMDLLESGEERKVI